MNDNAKLPAPSEFEMGILRGLQGMKSMFGGMTEVQEAKRDRRRVANRVARKSRRVNRLRRK